MRTFGPILALACLSSCIRSDRLAEQLEPACDEGMYPAIGDVALPRLNRPASPAPVAPRLSIEREQIFLDGQAIGSLANPDSPQVREGFADHMAQLERMAEYSEEPLAKELQVVAPKTTAAVAVGAILRVAQEAGFERVHLLAEPSSQPERPRLPRPELADELMAADAAERQMRLAETIHGAIWFCPDLVEVFQAMATADAAMKCEVLVVGMRESGFPCFGSHDTFETVMTLMWRPSDYTTFITVDLDPTQPIEKTGTWDELVSQAEKDGALGVQPTAP